MILTIDVEKRGSAVILRAKGQIDMVNSVDLSEALTKALDESATVALDLTAVPAIDSSGIGAIVRTAETVKKDGKRLVIFGLSDKLKKLFWVLKLDKNLAIFETESQALT